MKDEIIDCWAYDGKVSIKCISSREIVETARKLHDLSPTASAALGRLLTITSIMGYELKTENESLKQKNSELEQQLREYEIIKNENEQLKQELNLAEKYEQYTTVPGMIISRDISNYSKTLVINVGSDNGIKEKMTVIADEGLVGYVVSVTNKTAKIQTIVDSASATSCLASSTRDAMICKGTIESKSVLSASNIETNARIIQGDSVETSGLGGIYMKGIHVGKIKKVNEGSNKTDSYATIETAVDFEKIETVLVITNQ